MINDKQTFNQKLIDNINWDSRGLIPAIAQDINSKQVLMQAWVNQEALELTLKDGFATYWSRSRQQLWRKGESSGQLQKIHAVYLDCDNDSLLYEVDQYQGIACHTGKPSCFFQSLKHQS